MEKTDYLVEKEKLIIALSNKFNSKIIDATYEEEMLQGGTVADVRKLTGLATTNNDIKHNYTIVLKVQKKWQRHGDEHSWRREYDLYNSNLSDYFTDSFRWPDCYFKDFDKEVFTLWMEYADGVPGKDFTIEMFEKAASALGEFQGKLFSEKPQELNEYSNLSDLSYIKNYFYSFCKWKDGVNFIKNEDCPLPKHLHELALDLLSNGAKLWDKIEKLPIVFSQRDYWFTNIFYKDGNITCIDWDTTGFGYLGEDVASLIVDEVPPKLIPKLYEVCVPAYYEAFKEQNPTIIIEDDLVYEHILSFFFFRLVESYMYTTGATRQFMLDSMESIYRLKN